MSSTTPVTLAVGPEVARPETATWSRIAMPGSSATRARIRASSWGRLTEMRSSPVATAGQRRP
ncbi:hypothetical protein ACWKSP_27895 [Micromonosporaceae bacterium Da 78-11]